MCEINVSPTVRDRQISDRTESFGNMSVLTDREKFWNKLRYFSDAKITDEIFPTRHATHVTCMPVWYRSSNTDQHKLGAQVRSTHLAWTEC